VKIRRAFVLLEVLVAMVILSVAFLAILRGLFTGLRSMRNLRITEQSMYLAESLMQDFELESPNEGVWKGNFSYDPDRFGDQFNDYSYEIEVKEIEVSYRAKPKGRLRQELEPLYEATVKINFTDSGNNTSTRFATKTYLPDFMVFTDASLQANQLF